MSGGSYDYFCFKLQSFAEDLRSEARRRNVEGENLHLRLRFAALIEKCAEAARSIEWVDSGDYADGDEIADLLAVLNEPEWPSGERYEHEADRFQTLSATTAEGDESNLCRFMLHALLRDQARIARNVALWRERLAAEEARSAKEPI
jgi:hypothetical protein